MIFDFPYDTAVAAATIIYAGLLERFPELRIVLPLRRGEGLMALAWHRPPPLKRFMVRSHLDPATADFHRHVESLDPAAHIPFPPLDIFVNLPWRFHLLHALLQFDLIGFQTLRDQRHFIQCVRTLRRTTHE